MLTGATHTHYTGKSRVDRTDLDSESVRYMSRQGYDRADLDNELAPTLDSHRTERDTHRIDRGQDRLSHKHLLRSHQRYFLYCPSETRNQSQSKLEQKARLSSQPSANDHGFSHKLCAFFHAMMHSPIGCG